MTDDPAPLSLAEVGRAIDAEAERIRTDGTLPEGFEATIRERFEIIASDPRALEREVARRHAEAADLAASGDRASGDGASGDGAGEDGTSRGGGAGGAHGTGGLAATARRAPAAARKVVGPPARRVQRRLVVGAGGALDAASVRLWSLADRVERATEGSRLERAAGRLVGSPRGGVAPSTPASIRFDAIGHLGDLELDQFLEDELLPVGSGQVLHLESGEGALVGRLVRLGIDAQGRDPHHGAGDGAPMGALEALAHTREGSLSGLVLSGVTDRLTPGRARVLARLASRALQPGGRLVVISADPGAVEADDPVASDLSGRRPLHSSTWCALLAELGYEATVVRAGARGLAYAVSTRRPAS
jgi:hypothetical protein